jgi:hypothetical protein
MATGYSKIVSFTVICGIPACVELPMPPRGILDRVIVTQTSGDHLEEADLNIYDRRGACISAVDLNVKSSGIVTDISDSGGFVLLETDVEHNLKVGDQIELKNSSQDNYNIIQTVTEVVSDTEVVTDVAFTIPGSTPANVAVLWQTKPFDATTAPITHLIYAATKLTSGDYIQFDINRAYENKDNQSETMRCRYSALWLEVLTVGGGESFTYEIAYTCRADATI